MESHLHGRNYDEGTHNTGLHAVIEGEDEDHREKKSVIKIVKAKAKKIKDKLTHGHGHEEEEDDNDDEEEEEMVQDPEVHGAPMYESTAGRSAVSRPGLGQPAGADYLERPSVKEEDRHDDSHIFDPPVRPFGQWQEENTGLDRPTTHAPTGVYKHVSFNPAGRGRDLNTDQSTGKIGELTSIEEDPHAPKHQPGATAVSNYESKVTDPTGGGGKEAGITSILHSLDKMGIYDDSKPKLEEETKQYTGSHDQFAPDCVPKSFNPDKPGELPQDSLTGNPSNQSSSYTEKISSATSAIAGKAVAAKDAIASKLGYTGTESTGSQETAKSASPTEYAHKIAATMTGKLAPVYDKVADAGSTVMSKVQGTGTGTGHQTTMEKGVDKGVSVTTYLTERLRPGDEDKALSEVITHAFHRGNEEKGKAGDEKQGQGQDRQISDALHKREAEKDVGEGRPMEKVTESEEVVRRLGTGEKQKHSGGGVGNVSKEKGVVDRLKGAVSSWIGKGSEAQTSGNQPHT